MIISDQRKQNGLINGLENLKKSMKVSLTASKKVKIYSIN